MTKIITNFFKGILIGIANIIPGVSGGTIAVVLDIFDELIEAVNNIFKDFKKKLLFIVPIILGMAAGIVVFSSALEYSLEKYSFPTSMFFVGLVAGSLPFIYKKAAKTKFQYKYIPFVCVSIIIVVVLFMYKKPADTQLVGDVSFGAMLWLFFGGIVAAASMVVPGISGSFVMMVLGIYNTVLSAVSSIKEYLASPHDMELMLSLLKVLAPVGIGVIVGILLMSKIIEYLFKKYHTETYFVILGLIIGSMFGIFSDPATYSSGVNLYVIIWSAACFAVGAALSLLLGKK